MYRKQVHDITDLKKRLRESDGAACLRTLSMKQSINFLYNHTDVRIDADPGILGGGMSPETEYLLQRRHTFTKMLFQVSGVIDLFLVHFLVDVTPYRIDQPGLKPGCWVAICGQE